MFGILVAMPGLKDAVLLGGGAGSNVRSSLEDSGLTLPRSRLAGYRSLLPKLLMLGLRFSEARLALSMRDIEYVGSVGETSDCCELDSCELAS